MTTAVTKKTREKSGPPPEFDPADLDPPGLAEGRSPVSAVALDVSGRCNLACRYCAEASTQPRRQPMSGRTLEAAWRLAFPDGKPRPGCSIRLGSGEPLLALPLLRRLAVLIKRQGGSCAEGSPDVFLTTNGTLANAEVRDWIVSSGWHVKVSLDGPGAIHDLWRVTPTGDGTHDLVSNAVADLAGRIPEKLSVTAVLCRGADPATVFHAIAALGVRRIELVPVAHRDRAANPDRDDVESYQSFVESHSRRYLDGDSQDDVPALIRFETCVRRVMGYDLQRVPCGAGRSFVGVGPEGDIYPCFRFVGLEPYRIGHVSTGVDDDAAAAFCRSAGRGYDRRNHCRRCWAAPLCGGPCFACAEMFGPGDGEPVGLHCSYVLADARAAVRLVSRLRRLDPERLLQFIPGFARAFAEALG